MGLWGWDTESGLFRDGLQVPPLVCGSFADGVHPPRLYNKDDACDFLRYLLETGQTLVGAKVSHDFAVCAQHRPSLLPLIFEAYEQGRVRDVQIRQKLLDIEAGIRTINGTIQVYRNGQWVEQLVNLAELEKRYLGKDRTAEKHGPDVWRLRYAELDGIPQQQWPAAARAYALADAEGPLLILPHQGPDPLVDEVNQCRKDWALHLVSCWGLRTDGQYVEQLSQQIDQQWAELRAKFLQAGLFRKQPKPLTKQQREKGATPDIILPGRLYKTKPQGPPRPARFVRDMAVIRKRVQDAYAALDEPVPMTDHPTNPQIVTDRDTLVRSGDELLAELGGGGPVATVRNTFIPVLRKGVTVPINTAYNSLLKTGRIASRKPNVNNIPRGGGVREAFIPRPGYVFASVDYDCAELRSLAQVTKWLFGKSAMADFFRQNPNGDPHLEMAAVMLGITPDEAYRRYKLDDEQVVNARQAAKAVNFGYPGGLGVKRFIDYARMSYGVALTVKEARQYKRAWMQRWPEMRLYFDYISQRVNVFGDNLSIMQLRPGRAPHRRRGRVIYTEACNTLFQGLTADGAGHALWRVQNECYVDHGTALYGCRPTVFLYDQVIACVPIERAHEAAMRLRDVMLAGMQEWTPDIPATGSPVLMDRWYKGAKPVFKEGKLQLWKPNPKPAREVILDVTAVDVVTSAS